jgi:hypothetical protein
MDRIEDLSDVFGPIVYPLAKAPEPVQTLFMYVMACLLMNEEKVRMVGVTVQHGTVYLVLQSCMGYRFRVRKPPLSEVQEAVLHQEMFPWEGMFTV